MDKVQIYCLVMLGVGFIANLALDGQPKTGNHEFKWYVIAVLLASPSYGRIFGWW